MDAPLILIDNDLFILLAGSDLLEAACESLGFSFADLRRLDALKYMLLKPGRSLQKKPQAVLDKALAACDRVASLQTRPNSDDILSRLTVFTEIDGGEALLYATICENDCWLLGSGDIRAMVKLSNEESLVDIRKAVAGRVISLEVVCECLVKTRDVEFIQRAFQPVLGCDAKLMSLFGGTSYTRDCRLAAISSYRKHLESQVGSDLLYVGRQ